MIDQQAELARRGKPTRIIAKLNSLVDRRTIEALYRASQAGVPIDLIIRGICCLRPGQPGLSENIRVRSVVDRFLEHSRVIVFGEGEGQQVYLSSADWMPRNFERRVEVMFPVEAPELRRRIVDEILPVYLRDNQRARVLQPDGSYLPTPIKAGEGIHRSQQELMHLADGETPLIAPGPQPESPPPTGKPPKKKPSSKRDAAAKPNGKPAANGSADASTGKKKRKPRSSKT